MFDLKEYYNLILSNTALKGLALIVVSIISAKIVDIIFSLIFKRLVKTTKTTLDDKILQLLHKPIFYSILFVGFILPIKTIALPEYVEFVLVGCFKTVTTIIWLFVISKILVMSMDWASRQTASSNILQKNTLPLFNNLGKIGIGLFGAYLIFLSWDININGILASAGVLGVVLGLAAKDTVSNFFAGIFLMADAPFKEGDYILLDTGERGYVKKMGLRSTRFMTRDDIEITIPNSVIAASKIVNESGGPGETERVRVNIQIAYKTDIEKGKTILDPFWDPFCLHLLPCWLHLAPFCAFLAAFGVLLALFFGFRINILVLRTVDSVNTEIYKTFEEHNILIPFPTMNVLMPNESESNL